MSDEDLPPALVTALGVVRALSAHMTALERELEDTKHKLQQAWKQVPHFPVPQERPCHVCYKPTFDMFGDRPQCNTHPIARAGRSHVYADRIKTAKGQTLKDLWTEIRKVDNG